MVLLAIVAETFRDGAISVVLRYCTDGNLFNPRSLLAKTKMNENAARDFLFIDDCALNASIQSDIKGSVEIFFKACKEF